uniref:Uncharacterized protein n=1 Tax=Arundo donax TaxID=35708 RepID=A0A0A9B3W8_ARUDO
MLYLLNYNNRNWKCTLQWLYSCSILCNSMALVIHA